MTAPDNSPGAGGETDPVLAELVEEVARRLQAGEPVAVEAFAQAHPAQAAQLRRLWPTIEVLAALGGSAAPIPSAVAGPPAAACGTLGDFRLLRELGRGGMGVVYEAEQVSLGRRVALKVLPFAAALDARQLQRFKHEAQAAGHLSHPHIVPVYSVGCERGVHYYAMQFIDGQTLAALVESARRPAAPAGPGAPAAPTLPRAGLSTEAAPAAPLSARAVAELGVQAAEALDYAHEQGVVHRDVKPGNLLVDARGKLWVTDFGLARFQTDADLTLTGDLVGTLRYMSPEQALGRPAAVDQRTDVYGLGVTLYELLALRPAFDGRDRQALLNQIAQDEPVPPRVLNRTVPVELETVVLKALAKEPAERYPTARELADDLRRFLEHRPVRARRPSLADRAAKWARRHRPLVAAATAFLLLAVVGLTACVLLLAREQAETARARDRALERERALRQTLYAQDIGQAQRAFEDGDVERMRDLLDRHRPEAGQDDLRGFEWYYLRQRYRERPRAGAAVVGHQGDTYCVAYAPDGGTLASAGKDGIIRFWDPDTLRLRSELPGEQGEVNEVVFAPDGRTLASAGDDGTVWLRDFPSGRRRAVLRPEGHPGEMSALAFAPDGQRLAAGGEAGRVWLWDAATGAVRAERDLNAGSIHYLAFAPDGRTLASASDAGRALLLDADTLAERRVLRQTDLGGVPAVAFSHDGRTLASSGVLGAGVILWDAETGRVRAVLSGRRAESLSFSRDDALLAVAVDDGRVALWDPRMRALQAVAQGHEVRPWCVTFSPDGKHLAAAARDGSVKVWDVLPQQHRRLVLVPVGGARQGPVTWLAFFPDGQTLLTRTSQSGLGRWDALTGRAAAVPEQVGSSLVAPGLAPAGRIVTVGEAAHEVRVTDLAGGLIQAYRHPAQAVAAVALSADGRRVAFADRDSPRAVWLWDLDSAAPHELARLSGACHCLAFAPDGRAVAAGDGNRVLLLDTVAGKPPVSLDGHRDEVAGLAFSADGRLLATGSYDHSVRLWDVAAGKERNCLWKHRDGVTAVAFAPDGKTLASGAEGVILWSVANGQELISLEGNIRTVLALAFSPDGRTLAAGGSTPDGAGGAVVLWYGDLTGLPAGRAGEAAFGR